MMTGFQRQDCTDKQLIDAVDSSWVTFLDNYSMRLVGYDFLPYYCDLLRLSGVIDMSC